MQDKEEAKKQTKSDTTLPQTKQRRRASFGKMKLVAIVVLAVITVLAVVFLITKRQQQQAVEQFSFETILDVSEYAKDLDETWTVSSENPSISEAKIESDRGFAGYSFVIYFYKIGTNRITLSKGEEQHTFNITVSEDKQINIYPE